MFFLKGENAVIIKRILDIFETKKKMVVNTNRSNFRFVGIFNDFLLKVQQWRYLFILCFKRLKFKSRVNDVYKQNLVIINFEVFLCINY